MPGIDHVLWQAFSVVLAGIRAHPEQGAELGAGPGLVVSKPSRAGKNIRAAMDAFTECESKPG
jgi:hypothetical protein